MRNALCLLAGAAALLGLTHTAAACSPPAEGWLLETIAPSNGMGMGPGDPIVLRGSAFFPMSEAEKRETFAVEVTDADGAPVPGRLDAGPNRDEFHWYADAELAPGAHYVMSVYELRSWDDERHLVWSEQLTVGERMLEARPGRFSLDDVALFEKELLGECLEEEFCGGCFEAEVIGQATHWAVEFSFETPAGSYATARSMRTAVGADADEARTILARTRPDDLRRSGVSQRFIDLGPRALWPSETACIALEVHDPVEGVLIEAVECFDVPLVDPIETAEPEPEPPFEPDPDAPDGPGAGCDASGSSGGSGGLWAALLIGGLGLTRRRRGLWAAVATALLASGCTPDADPDGVAPEPCVEDCAPDRPIPQPVGELPPPVFGGALAATAERAVVGDPDRDQVYVVDFELQTRAVLASRRPGRVALDPSGQTAYVSLRDAGQIQVIDVARSLERTRFDVCPAPRGLAVQGETLHVACAGGALLSLDKERGRIERRIELAPDLRDVVVDGDLLHVSRFKQPQLWTLDADGAVLARRAPRTDDALFDAAPGAPTAAWRTVALPGGGALMLHQRARLDPVRTETPGGYGDPGGEFTCGGSIVTAEVTAFPPLGHDDTPRTVGTVADGVVVVDMAVIEGGLVVASAGQRHWSHGRIFVDLDAPETWGGCLLADEGVGQDRRQFTAVAPAGDGWVAFARDPAALVVSGQGGIALDDSLVADRGHALFHEDAGRGIACASCHPEGGEDGHAWLFERHGLRRTQELRGGIAGSAPFHWVGDMRDIQHLMDEVLTRRMGGPEVTADDADTMLAWIDAQPLDRVEPIGGGDPVAGALVFADEAVGCAGCHSGPRLTDDRQYDVGTGGLFSTPTLLGMGRRGTLMHDGCGLELADRFDPGCGGGDAHGRTSHLSATEIDDLIAYLASL